MPVRVMININIDLPGHSQSPAAIFARTTTRPYLKLKESTVVRTADITGGISPLAPLRRHPLLELSVHVPYRSETKVVEWYATFHALNECL